MAIQFVGGNTAAKAGSTVGNSTIALNSGLTGGIASAVSSGDMVIAAFGTGGTSDVTLAITDGTNPYTLIDAELYSNDGVDTNLRVAYKFVTSDTDTTFGPTGSTNAAGTMTVYAFRGVDSSTPLDVAAVSATGIDTVLADPPSISPSTAGAFIVCVGAGAHGALNATFTSSDLTDFLTIYSDDSNDSTIGIGHKDDWTSGAFNAAAFGFSGTDSTAYSWAALSIVLRPAPAVKIPLFMHHYKLMAGM